MKKSIKFAVVGTLAILSGSVAAAQLAQDTSTGFVDKFCSVAPFLCSMSVNGNGSGDEPRPKKKED